MFVAVLRRIERMEMTVFVFSMMMAVLLIFFERITMMMMHVVHRVVF